MVTIWTNDSPLPRLMDPACLLYADHHLPNSTFRVLTEKERIQPQLGPEF